MGWDKEKREKDSKFYTNKERKKMGNQAEQIYGKSQ